MFGEEKKLSM